MAIVANFKTNLTFNGFQPNLTVQFTDTSTGGPSYWFWDFGDGNYSTDQNPSHTYASNGTYDVSLFTFDSSGSSIVSPTGSDFEFRSSGVVSGFEAAYDAFLSASWSISGSGNNLYRVTKTNSTNFAFFANRQTYHFNFSAHSGKAIILKSGYYNGGVPNITPSSSFVSDFNSIIIPNPSGYALVDWLNVSSQAGNSDFQLNILDSNSYAILSEPSGVLDKNGWEIYTTGDQVRAEVHTITSSDTKNLTLNIYPKELDFVGTPLSGTAPLNVQFTDLSGVEAASSTWNFGNGISVTVAGSTNPVTTYTAIC